MGVTHGYWDPHGRDFTEQGPGAGGGRQSEAARHRSQSRSSYGRPGRTTGRTTSQPPTATACVYYMAYYS